jgi:hypothetical protein
VLPGETVCLDLKPTEANVTHEFHCHGNASGTEPVEEWAPLDNASPTWHAPVLTAGVNHPAKHEPVLQIGLGTNTYGVAMTGLI